MASELVKAGINVVVLEKGSYYRAEDFKNWRENEAPKKLYEKQGFLQTQSGSVAILAGSTVGGGTTLNWSASFRTPAAVMQDWMNEGLLEFSPDGKFSQSLDAVHELMSVNTRFSYRERKNDANIEDCDDQFVVNNNNVALWEGALASGFSPQKIPRNVKNCVDCGQCALGYAINNYNIYIYNFIVVLFVVGAPILQSSQH